MNEIFPGVLHWAAFKQNIGAPVSSYYVEPAGVVIDPILPDGGLDAFAGRAVPQQIVLTSGNHTRDAAQFAEAFGCPIVTSIEGSERIAGELDVETFDDGDDVAPGVRAIRIGVLSPDEYALHITVTEPALAIADGVNHYAESLGFFRDDLLGDDPEQIKAGLKDRFRAQLDRDFEHVLFAHGDPIVGSGKTALRGFVT